METHDIIAHGRVAEILSLDGDRVIKLFPEGASTSWVEREAENTRVARRAGLPVPRVFGVTRISDRPGIIMERVAGNTMLSSIISWPVGIPRAARLLARLHIDMHAASVKGVPDAMPRLERAVGSVPSLPDSLRRPVLDALSRLPHGQSLCHGDLHPGNVIMSPAGPVIIDWDNAVCGNPDGDLARTLLLLRVGPEQMPGSLRAQALRGVARWFTRVFLAEYRLLRPVSDQDLRSWTLVVAAARMSEGIREEWPGLVRIIRSELERD